MKENIRK